MLTKGSTFAGYEIVGVAGQGAMATTYRAHRNSDRRTVALKIPKPKFLRDPTFVVRFLQEAHLGARLKNRFIVHTYEAGEVSGVPFLAMEYLEGMTLRDGLKASLRLPVRRALQIALDVTSALEHAHAVGVIHRDLKPDNIMLRVGTCLKVMDFGIAKMVGEIGLTTSNLFIGSPSYSAPEMVNSSDVDHRADLYSLGIMLFEMIEGHVPFSGVSPIQVLIQHQSEPLPSPETLPHPMPRGVWRLIETLAAKAPEERLPDSRALRIALELLLRG